MTVTQQQLDEREDKIVQVFEAKMSALKAWMIVVCVSGQALAGFTGALFATGNVPPPVRTAAGVVSRFF